MNIDSFIKLLEALPTLEPDAAVVAGVLAASIIWKRAILLLVETACKEIERRGRERSRAREIQQFGTMSDRAYERNREMEILRRDRRRAECHVDQPGCVAVEFGCAGPDRCREPQIDA